MGLVNDTNSFARLLGRIRMGWRRERAVGVHEGAREGWLGAVGRPAEGWGTEVGRLWGGLRRRRAAWGGEGRPGPFKCVSTA